MAESPYDTQNVGKPSSRSPGATVQEEENDRYVVDKILDLRTRRVGRGKRKACIEEFLVQWEGYEESTWEARETLEEVCVYVCMCV